MRRLHSFLLCLGLAFLCASTSLANTENAEKPEWLHGFVDFNLYPYDTRDQSVYTINILATLPYDFQYFSFVNYEGGFNSRAREDLEGFYTEQTLSWHLPQHLPFDLMTQWVIASGFGNDALRIGVGWNAAETPGLEKIFKPLHLIYMVHVFPLNFEALDGYNWQMEHVYMVSIWPEKLDNRLYALGFLDHNIGPDGADFVTEHQLGVRLVEELYVVSEYRFNDFAPDHSGLSFGLEYKLNF